MEKKLETEVNKVQIVKERNLFDSTGSVVHNCFSKCRYTK